MQCKEKPEGDKYGFTHFALENCCGKGLEPLPSDSRRRGDRHALHVSPCYPLTPPLLPPFPLSHVPPLPFASEDIDWHDPQDLPPISPTCSFQQKGN